MNLEIAYLVPPFWLNVFHSILQFHKPVFAIARAVPLFLLFELMVLLIVAFIPQVNWWFFHGS